MEIAILSDTHVPAQADGVPDQFLDRVADADHVVHAGDFGSKAALSDVRALADDLTAVYGNADPADVDLPPVAALAVDGVTLVVSHGMVNFVERAVSSSEGVVFDRDDWLDAVADTALARTETMGDDAELVVGIGGHSHEVEDGVHENVRVLNPGSATGVGPAEGRATMMTAEVADDDVTVTVHERK
ncbi:putative phosphoesterase [Halorubrum trapanicum]|uniref:Phosphoesterase n=1 Tax=Halorubrum trapanicum TaxID=29284 RepID=A0A8J7UP77_9EURY|nr:metallophosphoesterase family protein [Halorubrum trapanicum]MBP1902626.1 putative phosphoesterase [Halorubrum trapanicum]